MASKPTSGLFRHDHCDYVGLGHTVLYEIVQMHDNFISCLVPLIVLYAGARGNGVDVAVQHLTF